MLTTLKPGHDWLLLGTDGHALALLDALRSMGTPPPRAMLDLQERRWGELLAGHRILGGYDLIASLVAQGCTRCVIGVGDEGDIEPRRHAHLVALDAGLRPMTIRHSSAVISDSARLAAGVQIMAGAIVGPQVELAANVLINAGALLQPRARVEADSHIAPGARVLGGASIGARTHIGAGTTILAGVQVGDDCLVGPGLVIHESMPSGSSAVGTPARVIRQQGWRIAG